MALAHGSDPAGKSVMPALRPIVMGRCGMVVARHYLAAQAGLRVLQAGGNAVDAGVAAGLVVNVVHNDMAGFGGVAPAIVSMAGSSRVTAISGIGRFPEAMSYELLQREHGGKLPKSPLRWVTPAAPDTWLTALRVFGSMTFAEVARDALYHAEHGYPVHYFQAANVADQADAYAAAPRAGAVYAPGGKPVTAGTVVRQPDLARTFRRLRAVAESECGTGRAAALAAARHYVYRGDMARELAEWSRQAGGLLTYDDLASFSVGLEDAVATTYRGYTLHSCGPWSQGPVLPMALNILEFGMPAQVAVEAPRVASFSFPATTYPNAYFPGDLHCEEGVPAGVRQELGEMGHQVKVWPNLTWQAGGLCVIQCDPNSGVLAAGADPRRETYAAGY